VCTISHDDGAVSVATSTNAADDTSGRAARSVALTSCDHVRVRVSGGGRAGGAGGRGGRSGGAPSRRAPSRMTTAPSASPPPPTPTTTPPAHRWRHSEPCERKMMSSMVGMAITGAGGRGGRSGGAPSPGRAPPPPPTTTSTPAPPRTLLGWVPHEARQPAGSAMNML
jgi:hypothetical protein